MIELAAAAAHVFVESLDALALSADDDHHLARALRLRPGERVSASDGRGNWRWCRWTADGLDADGHLQFEPRPSPPLTVGFALVKGDRIIDWIVQKLTEIGIDSIVPVTTQRCVVRWDSRHAAENLQRMQRIARAAAMQSRRVWLPSVEPVAPLATVLARPGARAADASGDWLPAAPPLEVSLIVVGPEGGWEATERDGFVRPIRLGTQVLRTDTAAICAATLLQDRRRSLVAVS